MLMSAAEYRESLRQYKPRVFINGRRVESVPDEPLLMPALNAIGVTYDFALRKQLQPVMTAQQALTGCTVNRFLHINRCGADLLNKLEAVRLVCQESGCAQRYLTQDALNAIFQATYRIDADRGTEYHPRLIEYLRFVEQRDLTCAVAMTDGKGDRSLRPHQQPVPQSYVRIVERRADGIVIQGVKAIVTGAPLAHELLVMPCRSMTDRDADFAVCCAVPVDAEGVTMVARPAGRPGEAAAKFSGRYGQTTAVVHFDRVRVPWERVFLAGEWEHSGYLTRTYATHHRLSCIGARAGFGDLLIGAGALMCEANGLDLERTHHLREAMVELIKIVEGFFACGVAASVYGLQHACGAFEPEPVFANIGKLLLSTQIYDMHRLAHYVSGGLVVALPGPEEDHNPHTAATLAEVLRGRPDIPYERRMEVARLLEDLTASYTGGWYSVISLHGGGSPEAMKMEIFRHYPLGNKVDLVERLLERQVLASPERTITRNRQPGRCCLTGCLVPEVAAVAPTLAERTRAGVGGDGPREDRRKGV
ncbi:4-hydroxyphenylacetate 3-hydroxylase family protein [Pelomicrobium methylotrophicum]|uniref:4-hydroxyphenylacetate 3-hydroxylase n=1 Tax=Pelomicrobium methylotrophicum TaxID=2602750 RepID=A0A5C7EX00_9PROT|nr:4-hydroxyphenylacetate 3-hydroxylase N-terminal domain-containing protein [Pelomicrobium methylotrophicum]TXF12815.1 4-hydroxyphenylacetate 3-hydroxylase [Pelomicrobium methylotrophicum]